MDAVDTIANVPHGVTNALCRYWKCVESGTSHEDALQLASSSDGSRSCLASALRLFQDVYSLSVDNEQSSSGDPVSVIDIADHREHTDAAEIQDSIRHVDYLLDLLEPRERDVLCYRFGVRGFEQQTLSQTGRKFDISKERVRQIETRALSKLAAAVCSA